MRHRAQRTVPIFVALGLLFPGAASVRAADQEIDRLPQNPVAKDWVTNGGNMTNQRYSTLKQIDTASTLRLPPTSCTHAKSGTT